MLNAALVVGSILGALVVQQPPAKSPDEEYQERTEKITKSLADKHCEIATYLVGQKMYGWARIEFNNAVKFVPNHEKANKGLGNTVWNEEDKRWEIDPNAKPPETGNTKKGDDEAKVWSEYQKRLERLGKDIARMYVDLGSFCAKAFASDKEKANAAYRRALEYDPLNKDARTKLGHVKVDGVYLSKEEVALRKELKEGIAKAPKGTVENNPSDEEQKMGMKFNKVGGEHIMIQSPHLDVKTLESLHQHAEHTYAMFHKIFNQSNLFGQRLVLTCLQNQTQHDKYVDIYGANLPADYRKQVKESRGFGNEWWQGDMPVSSLEDWVIHQTAMECSQHLAGGNRHWMHEGLAYYFTKFMHNSSVVHCSDMRGTGADGGQKSFVDGATWHIVIKEWLRSGKGEPDIIEVFKATKLSELTGGEPVKAWSVCEFLTTEHREKFVDFMQKVRAVKSEDDEKVLQEVFGWSLLELNNRWKNYARAAYADTK